MAELTVRDARPEDVGTILRLVRELATFEREPDAVVATEADFLRDGFGPNPRFHCRLADLDGVTVGFCLWFHNYSTWEGRAGIHLEDLYITPSARGCGIGERFITDLAAIAVRDGARRLDLSVLDWNPARAFYERLGLTHRSDWASYRIAGADLAALARRNPT